MPDAPATPCPSDEELSALLDGALSTAEAAALQAHVADCPTCGQVFALALNARGDAPVASTPSRDFDERYELRRQLGRGAMGAVHEAYDRKLDRVVALKWLHGEAAKGDISAGSRSRALAEAKALAKLSHPHVVQVYDVLAVDGQDVIAMEFVDGGSLRAWLDERRRGPREIAQRFVECAQGLHAAHTQGLAHRDFKPENVLVGRDGHARVVDFGMANEVGAVNARLRDAADVRTAARSGTPHYLAPELWRGEKADARSDQYAWGVSLYEALTRERLFTETEVGQRLAAMQQQAFLRRPAFRRLPWAIRQVVRRALEAQRDDRFPSMDAAARRLSAATIRRRWVVVAAALALLAASALGVWRDERACDEAAASLDTTWNATRSARLRGRLRGLTVPYAEQLAAEVERTVSGWAAAWRAEALAACRTAQAGSVLGRGTQALRAACLERSREQLDAQLAALEQLDVASASAAASAVRGLPRPSACAQASALLELTPRPVEPERAATVRAAEREVDALVAQVRLGGQRQAEAACGPLLPTVRAAGWAPLTATAALWCGRAHLGLAHAGAARALLREAVQAALASSAYATGASAAGMLIHLEGSLEANDDAAQAWVAVANGLLERGGLTRSDEAASVEEVLGRIAVRKRRLDEALQRLSRAHELSRALSPDAPKTAELSSQLAYAEAQAGRHAEALARADLAIEMLERSLGPKHPQTVKAWAYGALVAQLCHRPERALELMQRALPVREELFGPESPTVGETLANAADLALDASKPALALEYAERGVALLAKHLRAENDGLIDAQLQRVDALRALGRQAEACAAIPPTPEGSAALPDADLARLEWAKALCMHQGPAAQAALLQRVRVLRPRLGPEMLRAKREMDRLLGASDHAP